MSSEDEIEEESSPFRGVPATIVLINVFDPSSSKTAQIAHAATCRLVRQYLRQSTSQCVGVCLFGAEDTDDASKLDARSVKDVFSLTPPTLDDFKKLQDIDIQNIKQAKDFILSDALLHCSEMFLRCKKQLSSRTLIILTKMDTAPTQIDQKPTLKRVEDLVDSDVELRLINIAETEYQIEEFYKDFLKEANKGRDVILPVPIWSEKEIEKLMYQHSHRHLAVAKISFEIGNGLNIGVGVYSLMKSQGQTQHKTSYLNSETNAVLTSQTKMSKVSTDKEDEMDADEEQSQKQLPLLKSETLYYQEYGGERVEFTANEMKTIKNPFGPPMLKLLGFKPASLMCKEKWYLKKSYFLFPNDGIIEGSTVAFKSLHQACVETGMVAICILCTRVNSRPINVALAPCTNPLGLDIDIGFDVICIPFVENVRDISSFEDDRRGITDVEKKLMKKTIESIKFNYIPEMFENPKLQSEYRAIEAIAFNEQEVQPFVDTTKPKPEMFKDINDEFFDKVFGPFGVAPVKKAPALKEHTQKRKPETSNNSTAAKKKKSDEYDESELQSRLKSGKLSLYTVPQLKNILLSIDPKLPALNGLKKADLINLVIEGLK